MSKQILTNGRNISIDVNNKVKKVVMVVSHERSGTHFLMNSISNCQDVYTNNWFDFDPNVSHSSNINFYSKDSYLTGSNATNSYSEEAYQRVLLFGGTHIQSLRFEFYNINP